MNDDVLDWRTEAHRHGVHPWRVWNTLRQTWPRNSMWNYPYSPAHVDKLAADPTYQPLIQACIHDTANTAAKD